MLVPILMLKIHDKMCWQVTLQRDLTEGGDEMARRSMKGVRKDAGGFQI